MATPTDKQSRKSIQSKTDPALGLTTVLSDFKKSILENHDAITRQIGQLGVLQIETGNWLRTAKKLVPHGNFEGWFEEQFGGSISLRTGQRYMRASRIAEERTQELRERLASLRLDLDVTSLTDDEVIRELPSSHLIEIVSTTERSSKKLPSRDATLPTVTILNPDLLQAMLGFLGTPMLTMTTFEVSLDGIKGVETVVGKDPIAARTTWPTSALVLSDSDSIRISLPRIHAAFEKKQLKECLILVPSQLADHASFQTCPLLAFTRVKPLGNKSARTSSMALLLMSDKDRIPAFASKFGDFGVVKVPYVGPA